MRDLYNCGAGRLHVANDCVVLSGKFNRLLDFPESTKKLLCKINFSIMILTCRMFIYVYAKKVGNFCIG